MVAATKNAESSRSGSRLWSNPLYVGWLAIASLLILLGIGGFFYLRSNSPLSLLEGSDRPIAAAALFVPNQSPFSVSLLTRPDRLAAFVQSLEEPEQRPQTLEEIEQVKQQFLGTTGLDQVGLDYEQTIRPWIGDEVTFALVSADLEVDPLNGQRPGYLAAIEIAPGHQRQAKEFLQQFWQQQALDGNTPNSEKISGIRILSATSARSQAIKATALVGDQFILLANDVRVLRRSIQVAQTTENAAQNLVYRKTAAALTKARVGLAYFDLNLLSDSKSDQAFTGASIGLAKTGLVINALPAQTDEKTAKNNFMQANEFGTVEALKFLPADSDLAITGRNLSKLESSLATVGLSADALPAFLQPALSPTESEDLQWVWATGEYALGKVGSRRSQGWILVVERDQTGIAGLDAQAVASGYSNSLISIGEARDTAATAWTRLTARKRGQQSGNELETELLGLHLQQGPYEIFTDSLAAMNSALATVEEVSEGQLETSLVESERFKAAIAPLAKPNQGYIYLNWPVIAPILIQRFPVLDQVMSASDPFFSYIDTVSATRQDKTVSLFVHLKDAR